MSRKWYYIFLIVLIGLSLLLSVVMFANFGAGQWKSLKTVRSILDISLTFLIIIVETYSSRERVRKINSILIPLFLFGLLLGFWKLKIGIYLFIVCAISVIVMLFIETFSRKESQSFLFVSCIHLLLTFMVILLTIFHVPGAVLIVLLDKIVVLIIFVMAIIRLRNNKFSEHSEI